MGAAEFVTEASGKTMQEAWDTAKEKALYDHGHAGYSGTIAEKPGFIDCGPVPDGDYWDLFENEDLPVRTREAIENKWDECAGFTVKEDKYVFVGWASE